MSCCVWRAFPRHAPLVSSALACLLLFAGPSPLSAQNVVRLGPDRISIHAESVPLDRLLIELVAIAPLDILMIDPKVEHQPVTVRLENVPVAEAISRVLNETGLEFAVGGLEGQPLRVRIGSLPDARPVALRVAAARVEERRRLWEERQRERSASGPAAAARLEERRRLREERQRGAAGPGAARTEEGPEVTVTADSHNTLVTGEFTMEGENVTYHDPSFVPYKNRPEVKARRMAVDVTQIP